REARVEHELKLAGDDLYNFQFLGVMDLVVGQIKGALSGPDGTELNVGGNVGGLQAAHHPLRSAHADLGAWNVLRADFQVFVNVVKFNGNVHGDFGHGVAGDGEPQGHGQGQREQLQAEVVEHVAMEEVVHGARATATATATPTATPKATPTSTATPTATATPT